MRSFRLEGQPVYRDEPTTIDGNIFHDATPDNVDKAVIEHVEVRPYGLSDIHLRLTCGTCEGTTHTTFTGSEAYRQLIADTWFPPSLTHRDACRGCTHTITMSIRLHEMQPQSAAGIFILGHLELFRRLHHAAGTPQRWRARCRGLLDALKQKLLYNRQDAGLEKLKLATETLTDRAVQNEVAARKRHAELFALLKQLNKGSEDMATALDGMTAALEELVKQGTRPPKTKASSARKRKKAPK